MSTSSARPDDLDGWAAASRSLDRTASEHRRTLDRLHDEFVSSLGWGMFDASSMLGGFKGWIDWNETDARWVKTIAQAFRDAGTGTIPDTTIDALLRAKGLNNGRLSVTYDDPIALGMPPTSGYANDPVNTATGNFVETEIDLVANGLTRLLRFVRTYNSRSGQVGPFGPGWASWASTRLRAEPDGAHWEGPDGQRAVIPRLDLRGIPGVKPASEDGGVTGAAEGGPPPAAAVARTVDPEVAYSRLVGLPGLVIPHGEGLALEWFGGGRLAFDRDGKLLSAADGPGTEVHFDHDGDRLVELHHACGRTVSVTWDDTRITGLRSSDGRVVSYRYDGDGRMVEADGPTGRRRYEIDDRSRVVAVIDADGVIEARNIYDDHGRVVEQRSVHGRRTRFRYLPGRVTVVGDDGPTNSYVHDDHGRMVGVVDGRGAEMVRTYDRWGDPTSIVERDGSITVQEWDDRSRLVRRVAPDGAEFTFAYDDLDRVVEVSTSTGVVTRYRYERDERSPAKVTDPEGGITSMTVQGGLTRRVVDPDGVAVRFGFDAEGNLTSVADADGNTGVVERDGAGRVVATVSPTGLRTELVYDGRGLLAERHDPGGAVWRYEWSPAGRMVACVDPLGARTTIRHGPSGDADDVIDPLGHITSRRFDLLGNLVGVTLPDGAGWELSYDGLCRLTGTRDPAGASWLREYDVAGHLVGSVDPMGVHRRVEVHPGGRITAVDDGLTSVGFVYDELGRPIRHRRPDGTEMALEYDRCGRVVAGRDPMGGATRYERTPGGRLAAVTSPGGATTRFEHDRCGRRVATIDPLGHRWSWRYDGEGRVTRRVAPTGEIERWRFDGAGRLAAHHSSLDGVTRYDHDAVGRVVALTGPTGGTRRYAWDLRGQLVEATDPNGGRIRLVRDARGFLTTLVDPLGGRVEHRYDEVGRLVERTDQLGRVTTWEYDPAGRLVRRVLPTREEVRWWHDRSGRVRAFGHGDEPVVTIERDALGRPVVVDEPGFRHELVWDRSGRLVARSRNGVGLTWSYDTDGRAAAIGHPDGTETTYDHDRAGRMVAASHPALGRVDLDHDAAGRLLRLVATGVDERWTYRDGAVSVHDVERNGRRRVTRLERDAAGRVVTATSDAGRRDYRYDAAGQLVAVGGPGGGRTFRYDPAGRLATETGPGGQVDYHHDAAHQLVERRAGEAVVQYEHDDAGRRVSERGDGPQGASGRAYSWDWLGRVSGIGDTSLTVDAFGDLASIGDRRLLWDPVAAVPQLRWSEGTSVVGGEQPWATVDPAGDAAWIERDWQGSAGGTADAWGAPSAEEASIQGGIGYRGELSVEGLVWLRNRAYDPATRAFLSVDPVAGVPGDAFAANPYHYAGNDPVGALDPFGLRPMTEADLAQYRAVAGRNAFQRGGDWIGDNWEYIVAGAMIVGGIAIMATGVGGPIGAAMIGGALLSGGLSAGIQRHQTGEVDWGRVAVDGAIGGLAGGAGAWAGGARALTSMNPMLRGAAVGAGENALGGMGTRLAYGDNPFDPRAVAQDVLLGGGIGGAGGHLAGRANIPTVDPTPPTPRVDPVPLDVPAPTTLTNVDPDMPPGDVLRLYTDGSGFSGAYDHGSGHWSAVASGDASLVSGQPVQTVPRFGGHNAAQADLAARTGNMTQPSNVGFVIVKQGDNALDLRWNSNSINRTNFGQSGAPMPLRQPIRDSVADATGFEVTG